METNTQEVVESKDVPLEIVAGVWAMLPAICFGAWQANFFAGIFAQFVMWPIFCAIAKYLDEEK